MHCDKCGRVLNRATGRCVCHDLPPTTARLDRPVHPAAGAVPAVVEPPVRPIYPPAGPALAPPVFAPPGPEPGALIDPGRSRVKAFVGAATGRIPWHRGHDLFVFHDRVVLTKVSRQSYIPARTRRRLEHDSRMPPGMLGARKKARVVMLDDVTDVDVWRKPTGGRVTFWARTGQTVDFDWLAWRNRGRDPEDLLNEVVPDRIDRVEPGRWPLLASAVVKATSGLLLLALLVVALTGLAMGIRAVLDSGPPVPPPLPPPTTVPANVEAARAELGKVCPAWVAFEGRRSMGDRPRPGDLKPLVDGMRPAFDAAAASDPAVAPARDELGWLQDYAARSDDVAVMEATARIRLAIDSVDAACR